MSGAICEWQSDKNGNTCEIWGSTAKLTCLCLESVF